MIRAEIFPFFHHAAVGQMAYAVFAAIFVFADFGLAAFLLAEDGSGIRHADLWRIVRGGFRVRTGRKRNGSHSGVMGLPVYETCALLRQAGCPVPPFARTEAA